MVKKVFLLVFASFSCLVSISEAWRHHIQMYIDANNFEGLRQLLIRQPSLCPTIISMARSSNQHDLVDQLTRYCGAYAKNHDTKRIQRSTVYSRWFSNVVNAINDDDIDELKKLFSHNDSLIDKVDDDGQFSIVRILNEQPRSSRIAYAVNKRLKKDIYEKLLQSIATGDHLALSPHNLSEYLSTEQLHHALTLIDQELSGPGAAERHQKLQSLKEVIKMALEHIESPLEIEPELRDIMEDIELPARTWFGFSS